MEAQHSTVTTTLDRIAVVAALIIDANTCLAAQRNRHKSLPLKWEFPGGKVDPGETPQDALCREIMEEFAIPITVERFLSRSETHVGDRTIVLDLYVARRQDDTPLTLTEHEDIRWLCAATLDDLDWAEPDLPFLDPVRALLHHIE